MGYHRNNHERHANVRRLLEYDFVSILQKPYASKESLVKERKNKGGSAENIPVETQLSALGEFKIRHGLHHRTSAQQVPIEPLHLQPPPTKYRSLSTIVESGRTPVRSRSYSVHNTTQRRNSYRTQSQILLPMKIHPRLSELRHRQDSRVAISDYNFIRRRSTVTSEEKKLP